MMTTARYALTPGQAITVTFAAVKRGRFVPVSVSGIFKGYEGGCAVVEYQTKDLPSRFKNSNPTTTLKHDNL